MSRFTHGYKIIRGKRQKEQGVVDTTLAKFYYHLCAYDITAVDIVKVVKLLAFFPHPTSFCPLPSALYNYFHKLTLSAYYLLRCHKAVMLGGTGDQSGFLCSYTCRTGLLFLRFCFTASLSIVRIKRHYMYLFYFTGLSIWHQKFKKKKKSSHQGCYMSIKWKLLMVDIEWVVKDSKTLIA